MMEYIAAGFRSAMLAGWGAVLLVEWFGNDKGVGFRAHYWYDARSFDGMMAWGLVMMVIILAFDRIVMDRVVSAAPPLAHRQRRNGRAEVSRRPTPRLRPGSRPRKRSRGTIGRSGREEGVPADAAKGRSPCTRSATSASRPRDTRS